MVRLIYICIVAMTFFSCNENPCEDGGKQLILKKENSLSLKEISLLKRLTKEITLEGYDYIGNNYNQVETWKNSLSQSIKDSLLTKKYIIQKKYFLQNIILENEYKVSAIQKYNQSLEEYLSIKIGYLQGIPTVVFTTSIEDIDTIKNEYMTLSINRLLY